MTDESNALPPSATAPKAGFTREPWKIMPTGHGFTVHGDSGPIPCVCITDKGGYAIALVFNHARHDEANARVIVEAPNLWATLKELIDAGDFTSTSNDGVAAMIRFAEAEDAARALLAKVAA